MIFVLLPGATFSMGCCGHDADAPTQDRPVHTVSLTPFLIGKYEVTQAQWKNVMGGNPSWFQGDRVPKSVNQDRLPVESVAWAHCREFCSKLDLSMPTEAQWEYACRGGDWSACCNTSRLGDVAWFMANSDDMPHSVGQKQPNSFGLYDMQGNVAEWCEDIYDPTYYATSEARSPNPLCTSNSGPKRPVKRGGSWLNGASYCSQTFRNWFFAAPRIDIGLRPAKLLSIEGLRHGESQEGSRRGSRGT